MNFYLIIYELNKKDKDYLDLYESIKSYPKWWHYIDNCWIIGTDEDLVEIQKRIKLNIDEGDDFLIMKVAKPYSGWLPQKAWDWIEKNIV